MRSHKAKIQVQRLNCERCAKELTKRLAQIKGVDHMHINFETSMVYFSFQDIRNVADVENLLSDHGFNPVGEPLKTKRKPLFYCNAQSSVRCVDKA